MVAAAAEIADGRRATVREVCECLSIPRSSFYDYRAKQGSRRDEQLRRLAPMILDIFWKHRRRYGTRRIINELSDAGVHVSRRKVAEIMKMQGLRAIQPKSFKPKTTESRHRLGYSPNLLLEDFVLTGPNQLWVADITYIPLRSRRFAYLSMLMDRHSRRLIGWELADTMTEQLVIQSLRRAIDQRQPPPQLIHHSDRGGQYAGRQYRGLLRRASIRQSMSRAGDCYDNAFMESCFGTIKTELEMTEYETTAKADQELSEYFAYYNRDRKHSSLGYQTPIQFEVQNSGRK